jgi:hypothetical protein
MRVQTNADRAERAFRALHYYCQSLNQYEPTEETITDFLSDLRHYCKEQAIHYDLCNSNSQWNFNEEVKEN